MSSGEPWRAELRKSFTTLSPLLDFLEFPEDQRNIFLDRPSFPLLVPLRLAEKMGKGDPRDPLLLQFVSLQDETLQSAGFIQDAVGDQNARKAPKLLHKYQGRVLFMPTSGCAMNCRYCFRRHFDYADAKTPLLAGLEEVANDPSIHEVILSGGDPLMLSDEKLQELMEAIAEIPHVRVLRFHTRLPLGIPERITENFLHNLEQSRLDFVMVIHCNHPRELDEEVQKALGKLRKVPVTLLNQSVLLRGVNDEEEILFQLSQELIYSGIIPYYLHQLDRVQGAAHFEVPIERGKEILEALKARLPGYAIPKYVQEISGEPAKTLILG